MEVTEITTYVQDNCMQDKDQAFADFLEQAKIKNPKQIEFFRLYFVERLPGYDSYMKAFHCENRGSAHVMAGRLLRKVSMTDRLELHGLGIDNLMDTLNKCRPKDKVRYQMKLLGLDIERVEHSGGIIVEVIDAPDTESTD